MDYTNAIRQSIDFIHSRYQKNIQVADVAAQVYLSPSYFGTVFRTLTGFTVKAYICRYRLYRAALELNTTDKAVLALAMDCGYASQQAFTKSFSQQYGIGPARFRRLHPSVPPFPPENLLQERRITMELKEVFDNVRFEHKDDFLVMGIETDIDYKVGTANIGDLYARWNGENLLDKIPDQVYSQLTYGMTHESTENDTAKYFIGAEVSTLEHLPAGLIGRRFEGGEFAVFRPTLAMEFSGEFWRYFYGTWLDEQGLVQPDAVMTQGGNLFTRRPNYEVYDAYFEGPSSEILIYAPVLRD